MDAAMPCTLPSMYVNSRIAQPSQYLSIRVDATVCDCVLDVRIGRDNCAAMERAGSINAVSPWMALEANAECRAFAVRTQKLGVYSWGV